MCYSLCTFPSFLRFHDYDNNDNYYQDDSEGKTHRQTHDEWYIWWAKIINKQSRFHQAWKISVTGTNPMNFSPN